MKTNTQISNLENAIDEKLKEIEVLAELEEIEEMINESKRVKARSDELDRLIRMTK